MSNRNRTHREQDRHDSTGAPEWSQSTDHTDTPEGHRHSDSTDVRIPWGEPLCTDPESLTATTGRLRRAMEATDSTSPWTCPHCGCTLPGCILRGGQRAGCSDPKCRGRNWHDHGSAWLDQKRRESLREPHKPARSKELSPSQVRAIRDAYSKGSKGYKQVAKAHGVHPMTIRDIVTGRSYTWVIDAQEESHE